MVLILKTEIRVTKECIACSKVALRIERFTFGIGIGIFNDNLDENKLQLPADAAVRLHIISKVSIAVNCIKTQYRICLNKL